MVAVPYSYTEEFSFNANDRLPPQDIEAEEAVLGGILLDPNAIYRIKDRLRPSHFYIGAHKDIYQTCLTLSKKGQPTDLLHVTSWLSDHDLLARIGGRNKLATLVDRTVSAVNIDKLAFLIIEKAKRRDAIRLGNEIVQLGFNTEVDWAEIITSITERTKSVIEMPVAATKDEYQKWRHDRLIEELTTIYTTCVEPSLRALKLKDLADKEGLGMRFLETLYLKSLAAQCSKLLSYEELKELAGSTVREWLLNGLVPKNTTICLAADGGVGKTKLIYGLGKILIQGTKFGPFQTTGEKRRILYYQGDESEGDMLQALESLGYSESDINKYVKVRFGWSAENMPILIQDLKEFSPEMVVIDSLSTANRFSVYRESEMEYARPILEMTGLANQYKTTFVIIHHTNREGGIRGSTAIRNAVSEVWRLSKDNSATATPDDRILEIDKSRSRSSGKKYRLIFNPEDVSFTFMGEEGDSEGFTENSNSAKGKTLQFLTEHRNIRFTGEEIAHRLGISRDYARKYLLELASDGLISVSRNIGRASTYFLAYEIPRYSGIPTEDHPSDHPSATTTTLTVQGLQSRQSIGIKSLGSPQDHPSDHPSNVHRANDTAKGDPQSAENHQKIPEPEKISKKQEFKDHLRLDAIPDEGCGGDPGGDPSRIRFDLIHIQKNDSNDLNSKESRSFPQGDPGGDPQADPKGQNSSKQDSVVNIPQQSTEATELPLFVEKGRYWSKTLKREVEVFQIFDEFSEVSCRVPGRGTISLPFTDLECISQSPRHNFKWNDTVVILVGKNKESFATITSITPAGIFLKSEQGKSLRKMFWPHQLVNL
ncbi:MAG: AAA family ATPase [Goleter apudmare HA4340-LM2]|jgi:replicative DNA helicase|nr:AAA family ATPase [Goleter apudmare HA4340-LM2]